MSPGGGIGRGGPGRRRARMRGDAVRSDEPRPTGEASAGSPPGRAADRMTREEELRMLEEEERRLMDQLEKVSAAAEALRKNTDKEVK